MTKRALVVGASGGIGRAIAARLAGEGWTILAQGRKADALSATLDAVRRAGGDARRHPSEAPRPAASS
jgi:3-oxoacyl-[acyl-carrier protein] reductase